MRDEDINARYQEHRIWAKEKDQDHRHQYVRKKIEGVRRTGHQGQEH